MRTLVLAQEAAATGSAGRLIAAALLPFLRTHRLTWAVKPALSAGHTALPS